MVFVEIRLGFDLESGLMHDLQEAHRGSAVQVLFELFFLSPLSPPSFR